MLCRKPAKKSDENNSATRFMFGTQWLCTIFCFCLQILPEWIDEVSQDWPLIYWEGWAGGGGEVGGQGIQTSPLPYLKFPPPQTFSLASSLESRFSPCSLRNLEYCCVICRYFPCFPLFPTLFRTPTSRPFLPLHTYISHPLFAWAPTPSPLRLPHKNCSISFFILVKAF